MSEPDTVGWSISKGWMEISEPIMPDLRPFAIIWVDEDCERWPDVWPA